MILKLKRTPGIYLVGFMGSGKSTVGRLLADELGWSFADLDDDIQAKEKSTIPEIFETNGEAAFRELEAEALHERVRAVQRGRPTVLALGGGTFVNNENYELVENHGVTIWLDCPLDLVKTRVGAAGDRPLARDPAKLEELYHARRDAYARADYRVEVTSGGAAEVVARILALPLF